MNEISIKPFFKEYFDKYKYNNSFEFFNTVKATVSYVKDYFKGRSCKNCV